MVGESGAGVGSGRWWHLEGEEGGMCVCVCVCTCVCVCVFVHVRVCVCVHLHVKACV